MKLKFDAKKGLILVPITIKGPANIVNAICALDTGASYTVIRQDVLYRAGYKQSDYLEKITTTTASKNEQGYIFKITSIGSFGLIRRNFKIVSLNLPSTLFVDGLLGLDFFRNKELNINFRKGEVTLL